MILQLNPPLPIATPRGPALAHLVIDMGAEHHLLWVCFLDEGGACWTFPNPEIRMAPNPTMGRVKGRDDCSEAAKRPTEFYDVNWGSAVNPLSKTTAFYCGCKGEVFNNAEECRCRAMRGTE